MKTKCPAVNYGIENKFEYSFDLNIRKNGLGPDSSFIMVQWHGTPTGQLLRDSEDKGSKYCFI